MAEALNPLDTVKFYKLYSKRSTNSGTIIIIDPNTEDLAEIVRWSMGSCGLTSSIQSMTARFDLI